MIKGSDFVSVLSYTNVHEWSGKNTCVLSVEELARLVHTAGLTGSRQHTHTCVIYGHASITLAL